MVAGRHDFICDQGETWIRAIQWIDRDRKPMDAFYPAHMQVREGNDQIVLVTVAGDDNFRSFENGLPGIDFISEEGAIILTIPQEVTRTFPEKTYYYDLFVTRWGKVHRLLAGHFQVRARIALEFGEAWP